MRNTPQAREGDLIDRGPVLVVTSDQASPQFAALIVIMYVYGLRVFWYF